ncbi:MAG: MFS transporter [Candidatus Eremiobacteraeota bacterium]|nr:MFS transporter [Candidatus Eremiobacteraeota bacterium]
MSSNPFAALTRDQRNTFIAAFLGWTLDAFDFFLLIVVVPHIAKDFGRSVAEIAFAVTLTLLMRPVGALLFGYFADRYGRRIPLMVDVALFSVIELLTAFSPNFTVLLVLRAIFGIAMGGEWGLGAAITMETLPAQSRGFFSGMLQEGYAVGNLLAGLALALLYDSIGWRGMFVVGVLPAVLIFFIRSRVPESPAWLASRTTTMSERAAGIFQAIRGRGAVLFVYVVILMAAFNFMSHGSQDLYPTFLAKQRGFDPHFVGLVNTIASIGAIAGGISFGWLSQRFGRRAMIITASAIGLVSVPLWAFAPTTVLLALGGFIMQFMVQGAWGIIPAHLNEISPASARGTFPGFTYQLGNALSAGALQIEATIAQTRFSLSNGQANYAEAMSVILSGVFVAVILLTAVGYAIVQERRHEALVIS